MTVMFWRKRGNTPYPVTESTLTSRWPTLKIYELYYSKDAWPVVGSKAYNRFYRGMCVMPGLRRPFSYDLSAPKILPILNDLKYQSLLCEYGAIISVGNDAENWGNERETGSLALQPSKWVAFQSWRAKQKNSDLLEDVILKVEKKIQTGEIPMNAVLYWGIFDDTPLYTLCARFHSNNCLAVYSQTFKMLFSSDSRLVFGERNISQATELKVFEEFLPPLPEVHPGWSYYSYFAMSWTNLVEYNRFSKAFFVTMEYLFNVHNDENHCPIDPQTYPKKLCWCFIMERLINIWLYHSGKPTFLVNRLTGELKELPKVQDRNMTSWFSKENVTLMLRNFRKRLSGESLSLYQQLNGR